jgi:hypothetical protein
MVIRPKHVAVTEQNIQTSVALDGNPEPDLFLALLLTGIQYKYSKNILDDNFILRQSLRKGL